VDNSTYIYDFPFPMPLPEKTDMYTVIEAGSIKEREAWADYKLSDEVFDHKIAEGLMKAKREKLLSVRTSIDALRTLNANVRAQVQ
jgi:hypothetical protein